MGLPTLSLTLILSLSKFRARREMGFFVKKGFTQKNPLVFTVPLYSPNSTNTTELLGFTKKKPGHSARQNTISNANSSESRAVNPQIARANKMIAMVTMMYPDTGEYTFSLVI